MGNLERARAHYAGVAPPSLPTAPAAQRRAPLRFRSPRWCCSRRPLTPKCASRGRPRRRGGRRRQRSSSGREQQRRHDAARLAGRGGAHGPRGRRGAWRRPHRAARGGCGTPGAAGARCSGRQGAQLLDHEAHQGPRQSRAPPRAQYARSAPCLRGGRHGRLRAPCRLPDAGWLTKAVQTASCPAP